MKILEQKKGITLIALVVTIIVLLILAGVSISMITGNEGILNKAKEAEAKNKEAEVKETEALYKAEIYVFVSLRSNRLISFVTTIQQEILIVA